MSWAAVDTAGHCTTTRREGPLQTSDPTPFSKLTQHTPLMHPFLKGVIRFHTTTTTTTRSHLTVTVPRYFGSCRFYTIMADNKASAAPVDKKPKDNGTREVKILMLHGKMSLPVV